MPQAQAYYLSLDGDEDNVSRTERELIINCCGLSVLSQSFQTHQYSGRQDYYLQYMIHGEMDVWIDGEHTVMKPGQAIVYFPRTPYHYAMHGSRQVQYYWIHFTGSQAASLVVNCGIANKRILEVGTDERLFQQFQAAFREFITRDDCFHYLCAARLTTILVETARKAAAPANGQLGTDRRIFHSLRHIHTNYSKPLTVEELAELEHLSVSRFRSVFKASTGLSPLNYLIVLRVNHARQLIMQTDLSINEIADTVGYQDQLYFSRIFKKRTGYTPTEYKELFRLQPLPPS